MNLKKSNESLEISSVPGEYNLFVFQLQLWRFVRQAFRHCPELNHQLYQIFGPSQKTNFRNIQSEKRVMELAEHLDHALESLFVLEKSSNQDQDIGV